MLSTRSETFTCLVCLTTLLEQTFAVIYTPEGFPLKNNTVLFGTLSGVNDFFVETDSVCDTILIQYIIAFFHVCVTSLSLIDDIVKSFETQHETAL
jgi:hypothetical protein